MIRFPSVKLFLISTNHSGGCLACVRACLLCWNATQHNRWAHNNRHEIRCVHARTKSDRARALARALHRERKQSKCVRSASSSSTCESHYAVRNVRVAPVRCASSCVIPPCVNRAANQARAQVRPVFAVGVVVVVDRHRPRAPGFVGAVGLFLPAGAWKRCEMLGYNMLKTMN